MQYEGIMVVTPLMSFPSRIRPLPFHWRPTIIFLKNVGSRCAEVNKATRLVFDGSVGAEVNKATRQVFDGSVRAHYLFTSVSDRIFHKRRFFVLPEPCRAELWVPI